MTRPAKPPKKAMTTAPATAPSAPQANLVHAESFNGPLPHPQILAAYEAALPGLAGRIVSMAEGELELNKARLKLVEQQQETERIVTTTVLADTRHQNEGVLRIQRRGQWFAFILAVLALAVAGVLAVVLKTAWALTAVLGPVCVGLAGAFIAGRVQQQHASDAAQLPPPPTTPGP